MNPYEVSARFAHSRAAGRITGRKPLRGRTEYGRPLKDLEQPLVWNGIIVSESRTPARYEVKLFTRNETQYRKVVRT